ncbi:hypothetical protein G9A89_009705 [Geosiphon pyriformis]|nr:hypothetical protein G9A89_009705 [Geosiphon pyriformis]
MRVCHNCNKQGHIRADYSESLLKLKPISNHLSANNAATNLSTASISTSNLSTTATSNLSAAAPNNLSNHSKLKIGDSCSSTDPQLLSPTIRLLTVESEYRLLVTPEDVTTNNSKSNPLQTTLTNNIPSAMVTKNESFTAIFPFKLKETINPPLFSRAALKKKPITTMYTDAKVDGHFIKLILDSGSAGSIITRQLMNQLGCQVDCTASTRIITANEVTKTPIREIDNFPIEINSIIVPIKVFIMEATQYQALIGNDWLSKTNATLDWNTQELQLSQNSQHTRVPVMCSHFKSITTPSTPLIKFEEEKTKPTWEAYQVSWANIDHNKLLPILIWNNNDNGKKKQREKPTWEAIIDAWIDNNQSEMPPILDWKEKEKGRKENIPEETTTAEEITSGWERKYSCEPIKELPYIPFKCKNYGKKLFLMRAWVNDMATQKDKASETTNHVLLVANNYLTKECGMTFLIEEKHATLHANTQSLSVTG